jgi:dUTPase
MTLEAGGARIHPSLWMTYRLMTGKFVNGNKHMKGISFSTTLGVMPTRIKASSKRYRLHMPKNLVIEARTTIQIDTGIKIDVPENIIGLVTITEKLAMDGLLLVNAPSLIDSDYKDTIRLMLYNHMQDFNVILKQGCVLANLTFVSSADVALVMAPDIQNII